MNYEEAKKQLESLYLYPDWTTRINGLSWFIRGQRDKIREAEHTLTLHKAALADIERLIIKTEKDVHECPLASDAKHITKSLRFNIVGIITLAREEQKGGK